MSDGGRIRGRCAACGLPGHRYGTTDPQHDYSATACINGLTFELGVMSEVAVTLARRVSPDLATLLVAETILDEKQRRFALHSFAPPVTPAVVARRDQPTPNQHATGEGE